ncbi:hypothetical protein [Deinococcus yavapaiensis]|uniref:Uncharacterized protein n=1 Tax=Deinococcus yavapaiensis KR-236 TaxID=694435 RepID=A0A318SKA5_9DEIO|nr:hypothetical protein [Deinococcus yavapaiensis]PYE52988.1 hypothetical protein DES52_111161 [Deinococcus yavapaiensis KR-236]
MSGDGERVDVAAALRGEHGLMLSPGQVAARLGVGSESVRQLGVDVEDLLGAKLSIVPGRGRQWPEVLVGLVHVALRRAAVDRSVTQREAIARVLAQHGWIDEVTPTAPRAVDVSNEEQLRQIVLQFDVVEQQFSDLVSRLQEGAGVQVQQARDIQARLDRFAAEVDRMSARVSRIDDVSARALATGARLESVAGDVHAQLIEVRRLVALVHERRAAAFADAFRASLLASGTVGVLIVLIVLIVR